MNQGLFYVRRHTCADGSFEWYVLNGHTRRRASNFFPTRPAAVAERRKLQGRSNGEGESPQANAESLNAAAWNQTSQTRLSGRTALFGYA